MITPNGPGQTQILNSSGTLVGTIPTLGSALALDVGGTSVWIGLHGGSLAKYDLTTGKRLAGPFNTGLTYFDAAAVYGEPRAAFVNGPLAAIPALSPGMLLMLAVALAALAMLRLRM